MKTGRQKITLEAPDNFHMTAQIIPVPANAYTVPHLRALAANCTPDSWSSLLGMTPLLNISGSCLLDDPSVAVKAAIAAAPPTNVRKAPAINIYKRILWNNTIIRHFQKF